MPLKKDARKRTKKPGKVADLPAKSLKGKDAAKVKGGMSKTDISSWDWGNQTALKIDGVVVNKLAGTQLNTTLKISQ